MSAAEPDWSKSRLDTLPVGPQIANVSSLGEEQFQARLCEITVLK